MKFRNVCYKSKSSFYRSLFKKSTTESIFAELLFNLQYIPLKNKRKVIFEELKQLFRRRHWIGFYALALSQVEGLFTEMYQATQSENDAKWHSLPVKVEKLRPFFALSRYYFDYYEYHIPKQCNRFMHVGIGEDYKLQSFDLLLDLRHLLKVFQELDNPYVKVHKLIKQRDAMKFMDYRDFAHYFSLLEALPKDKLKGLEEALKNFEKEFLVGYAPAEYICTEIYQELPKLFEGFISNVNNLTYPSAPIDFSTIKAIKTAFEDAKLKSRFTSFYYLQGHDVHDLAAYAVFLQMAGKYLPSLPGEYKKLVSIMHKQYGQKLKHIATLGEWLLKEDKS